jgi:hypothetical protein
LMGVAVMDAQPCRRFFLEPHLTFHRRYEALRAFFVDHRPPAEIAAQFGYKLTAFNVMISQFRAQVRQGQVPPFSSPTGAGDHPADAGVKISPAPKNRPSPTSGSWTSNPDGRCRRETPGSSSSCRCWPDCTSTGSSPGRAIPAR